VTVRILEDNDEHENEGDFSTSEFRFSGTCIGLKEESK
jgi:hypothetical protein